jgi:myo-inositol-1(or 4)-monophosphatase
MTKNRKTVALQAITKAGKMLVRGFKDFDRSQIALKSRNEVLTKYDLLSEEMILHEIKSNFPMDSILSEERGRIKGVSGYLWILDPIDGTTNFSMHNPIWSVSLAIAKEDNLVFGAISAPMLGELFTAEAGQGAKLNGKSIRVSSIKDGKIINTYCHGRALNDVKRAIKYHASQKKAGIDCRQLGSAAIELAFVAAGRVESIVIPGTNDWDVAAGSLIVKEAGGRTTDFKGKAWTLGNRDIAASNGLVHQDILRKIK